MSTNRIGTSMVLAATVGLLALLTWLFSDHLDRQRNPNQDIEQAVAPSGAARVALQRNRAGHYLAVGQMNGVSAELMLDTGATDVAVPEAVARRAGLPRGRKVQVVTANGYTHAFATTIKTLQIGSIIEHDVPASIVPNMTDIEVLLGMSFLKRLDFTQRGDQLILESRRTSTVE